MQIFTMDDASVCHLPIYTSYLEDLPVRHLPSKVFNSVLMPFYWVWVDHCLPFVPQFLNIFISCSLFIFALLYSLLSLFVFVVVFIFFHNFFFPYWAVFPTLSIGIKISQLGLQSGLS